MKREEKGGVAPSTLRRWVLVGTLATTAAGAVLLITFARLQASLWVWQDGFFLSGDQWFNAARTTVTLVGIIGLGGAAFLAYRKQVSTEKTHLLEQSSGLRDRYTTVAEQLGNDSAAIRLAGVYALASLADDWHNFGNSDERQVCVDLLCAYLRTDRPMSKSTSEPTPQLPAKYVGRALAGHPRLRPAPRHPPVVSDGREEQHVRMAIINSITARTGGNGPWTNCRFNLSNANLRAVYLLDANLAGMKLNSVDLAEAYLTDANLHDANLHGANLADASASRANLTDAILIGAELPRAYLKDANLTRANLFGAELPRANLTGANLTDANAPRAKLTGAELPDTNLTGANLSNANLIGADLSRANLTRTDLSDTNLSGAYLIGANLIGANLADANLTGAILADANLTGAILVGANLTESLLTEVNLSGVYMGGANLTNANLSGANLTEANLTEANLTGAYLRSITYDLSTRWPRDFIPPPSST